jgi:tRNA(Ile)-lysidine synthase
MAVGYSGGADSTALLLAARAHWPGRVVALHVHHGLQAAGDDFESHARTVCTALDVPLRVAHVDARHPPGVSPEDAARRARYAALAGLAHQAQAHCVLLGQHADDQAETVVLALSRGAGLPGVAGMAEHFVRNDQAFGRPLLGIPAKALRAWLEQEGHLFVDDPSNLDQRYTRNRIRAQLMPAWAESFPGFREALARTARHSAQAQSLLDALAQLDLDRLGSPPRIDGLQLLSDERQANALRRWLRSSHGVAASEAQMLELLRKLKACRTRGHGIHIKVADGHVVRSGERLSFTPSI